MANKIIPIPRKETVNYGDRIVENFWKPKVTTSFTQSGHKKAIISLLQNVQSGFVCVCSEKLEDKDIIKLLFDLSEKLRVYILVNDYSKELDIINGKALIRFGVNNIGSFVLVNPNSNAPKGICFGGQMTDESLQTARFSFELRIHEMKELFRHFCYYFWETAQMEAIDKNSVNSKPIDIYYDADKFGGKDYVFGTLFDFIENTERVKLSRRNIIYFGKEKELPTEIKLETSQDLGDNPQKELLPKEEFEAQKPTFKDDGVSVQITYSWQNVPFYLPANAKEHNLYTQWNNEKNKINSKLSMLLSDIENLEKKENTLSKKIILIFLGKKNLFADLKSQISELQNVDFSNITKDVRDEKIMSINEISSKISSHSREIDKENKKAKLEDEIEKYQQEVKNKQLDLSQKKEELSQKKKEHSQKDSNWKTLKEELQTFSKKLSDKEGSYAALGKNLSEINHEIAEKSKKIDEISQKIDEISPKIKEEKVEDKKNKLSDEKNKLSDEKNKLTDEKSKLSDEKNKLSDEKYKLSESLDAVKKESEKLQKEIEDYTKTIKELTSKEKTLKDELKLLDTFIKRDEEDKNKIEKEINLLENTIKSKQTEIQKIDSQDEKEESSLTAFSSKKDKKQQNSNATKDFEIQNLPWLPQTGKLFSANGTPYLAIDNWEEYDDGMSEAKRLNAKLCATK